MKNRQRKGQKKVYFMGFDYFNSPDAVKYNKIFILVED